MATGWIDKDSVIDYLGNDAPAADDVDGQARLDDAIISASECLYALSGRKFPGIKQSVVRPVARLEQSPEFATNLPWPMNSWGFCCGGIHATCYAPRFIGLGRSPIVSIEEITIGGDVVDPINYRVDDQKWLMKTDCCSGWPTCGDCGDFIVSFTFGQNPPQMGKDAALVMSAEIYRAMTPGVSQCKLPARLTSITRQGVSFAVIDPMDFLNNGLTGVYQIDMFINAFNPARQIRKPLVWSPDMVNTAKRQTWPSGG